MATAAKMPSTSVLNWSRGGTDHDLVHAADMRRRQIVGILKRALNGRRHRERRNLGAHHPAQRHEPVVQRHVSVAHLRRRGEPFNGEGFGHKSNALARSGQFSMLEGYLSKGSSRELTLAGRA